jgi:AsmA protein
MKKTFVIIGSILVLAVVALLIVPALIPVDTYKSELLTQVEKATGRRARIDGEFSFSLLPQVEFTAGKFSIANAPGGKATTMISLDKLDVRVALLPLLSGTVVVDSFVLDKPVINLEVDSHGRPNWEFVPATEPLTDKGKSTLPAGRVSEGKKGLGLAGLQLGDIRLVNGKIAFSDARTSGGQVIDAINMSISLPSLTSPLKADGSLVWNKEKISLKLGVDKPDEFLKGKSTGMTSLLSAGPLSLQFKGQVSSGIQIKASGAVNLDIPSVRKLANWLGQPLSAPNGGFGPLKIVGRVGIDGQKYSFTEAKLSLDKIEANGAFRYDASGKRPYLNARLDVGVLDLNPYLPPEKKVDSLAGQGGTGSSDRAAPQGWSNEPIDLSGLRQANADAVLNVAGLQARKIKVGKSQVTVALKNGRLVTELTEMALYNGSGKATIVADGGSVTPVVEAKLGLSGLQANPALKDAMDMDRIEGTLSVDLLVRTNGVSQRALVSALAGNGNVKFDNGAIRGINLGAMVRNASSAFLDPKAREQQKTDFAELSGTFKITNGILRNDDLALLSPLLRVAGKGTVDLPNQTVNYRIEPKVVTATQGQGGKTDAAGLMVPVVVSGPWHALSYRPDLAGMIGGIAKDPSKALEELKALVPGTSKSETPSGPAGTTTPPPDPADALKKLFGR